ncbi:hypothetical protein RF11_09733 [Thelohanellus kitauei]|uniref:Uncharacterized protein n=1 Tax=Thelohanellus kitauei TaxID=669202 RepID=A0A0C2N827_THEKT|nr:hypothetical protein RF11_09733 [Thelohanellus kitauei]
MVKISDKEYHEFNDNNSRALSNAIEKKFCLHIPRFDDFHKEISCEGHECHLQTIQIYRPRLKYEYYAMTQSKITKLLDLKTCMGNFALNVQGLRNKNNDEQRKAFVKMVKFMTGENMRCCKILNGLLYNDVKPISMNLIKEMLISKFKDQMHSDPCF